MKNSVRSTLYIQFFCSEIFLTYYSEFFRRWLSTKWVLTTNKKQPPSTFLETFAAAAAAAAAAAVYVIK